MLLPYGTDAPSYHWPRATVALIVANFAAYFYKVYHLANLPQRQQLSYALQFGAGLHPQQWITSQFMYDNKWQLLASMVFLWVFGMVLEGMLGAWRFVSLYLGIGAAQAALVQWFYQGPENKATSLFGPSAALYGLLALCVVWRTRAKIHSLLFVKANPVPVDIPLPLFELLYLVYQVVLLMYGLSGSARELTFSAWLLQFLGLALGFLIGMFLLLTRLVKSENLDIISVLVGREKRSLKEYKDRSTPAAAAGAVASGPPVAPSVPKPSAKASAAAVESPDTAEAASREVHRLLASGDHLTAFAVYDKTVRSLPAWQPEAQDWLDLIQGLIAGRHWRPAVSAMEDYLKRSPEPSHRVRLKLAQILLRERSRPAHALHVLKEIPDGALSKRLEELRGQLVAQANSMRGQGIVDRDIQES